MQDAPSGNGDRRKGRKSEGERKSTGNRAQLHAPGRHTDQGDVFAEMDFCSPCVHHRKDAAMQSDKVHYRQEKNQQGGSGTRPKLGVPHPGTHGQQLALGASPTKGEDDAF